MKYIHLPLLIFIFCCLSSCQKPKVTHVTVIDNIYNGISFDMPKVPVPIFPDYSINISDFGAIGDGKFLNTQAFSQAINRLAEKGGGSLVVPRGLWLTGPITLQSNINLHTEEGAVIIFSSDFDLYPLVQTSFEGLDTYRCLSPINGQNLKNVAITGKGIFDGSGDAWRPVKKSKMTESQWKKLQKTGGDINEKGDIWYPTSKALKGAQLSKSNVPNFSDEQSFEEIKDFLRPVMLSLVNCTGILLDGPTFQNSPAWCLHPLMSQNIIIRNISVKNPWYSQNGDGLDIESCKNVLVYNCSFDVGDDAICIKSGKDEDGRKRGIPTENVIVKNCTVYHGHGGFTVGSEMSGGVKNVHVSHCSFIGTDVGLRFKSTRGRGGVVEKIYISNINMLDIPGEALSFNLYYTGKSPIPDLTADGKLEQAAPIAQEAQPITEKTPAFRDIFIDHVQCIGAGQAVILQGLPEMNLQRIKLENVYIESEKGLYCIDAKDIFMKNVSILASKGPAIFFNNTKNIEIVDPTYSSPNQAAIQITGSSTENIRFKNGTHKNMISLSKYVQEEAVSID